MRVSFSDSHCRPGIHPMIKLTITLGPMILLPYFSDNPWGLFAGLAFLVLLLLVLRLRVLRFFYLVWRLMRFIALFLMVYVALKTVIHSSVDLQLLTSSGLLLELLMFGIVLASALEPGEYYQLLRRLPWAWVLPFGYRTMTRLFEDMLDEVAVLRCRKIGLVRSMPELFEKHILSLIRYVLTVQDHCCLKGTLPW